jgi:ribokinase
MTLTPADMEEPFICCPDALYMQMEIPYPAVVEAVRRANEADVPVFIDAGPASVDYDLSQLGRVEIFSPNESETRIFTGIAPTNDETCLRAAIRLSNLVDAKYIVIKLGERGAFIYDVGGKEYYVVPAEKVEAVDTTAAGDVFTAAMVYVYLQNGSIVSAVKYATCAAAISVTRAGASTSIPTRAEVIAYARKKKAEEAGESAPETTDTADEPASGDEELNEI